MRKSTSNWIISLCPAKLESLFDIRLGEKHTMFSSFSAILTLDAQDAKRPLALKRPTENNFFYHRPKNIRLTKKQIFLHALQLLFKTLFD